MKDATKIVIVCDRSGSMSSIRSDMEGGIATFLDEQRKNNVDECDVTLVQFDNKYDVVYSEKPIQDVPKYSLVPRGYTALYDAIGRTIDRVGADLAAKPEKDRPSLVVFVIVTDGYENSSREYSARQIKNMIDHQSNKYNWDFVFLGANQDAIQTGETLGIKPDNSLTFAANSRGVKGAYDSITRGLTMKRIDKTSALAYFNVEDRVEQDQAGA